MKALPSFDRTSANVARACRFNDDSVTWSKSMSRILDTPDLASDLILEQLARNRVFLGDEGLAKLRSSFVVVVGCGASS
jgi:hypothetical protein